MRGMLMTGVVLLALARDDVLTPERRRELTGSADALSKEGLQQYQRGEYVKARESFRAALEARRTLYPREQFPQGHRDLASSLNNLALTYQAAREYGRAESLLKEALDMKRALYPKKDYPDGHNEIAVSLNNLAYLYELAGESARAEPLYREALDMRRALFPPEKFPDGNVQLVNSLKNLAELYKAAGEQARAEPLLNEALKMCRALYPPEKFPNGHSQLAELLDHLAVLYLLTGEYGRAEPLSREALEMCRALSPRERFPRGTPQLAGSLINLAYLLRSAGEHARAERYAREALAMCRALYPRDRFPAGHPQLVNGLNNLAFLHSAAGEYGKAEALYREALDLCRALYPAKDYPRGHVGLVRGLNNLAFLYECAGERAGAEPLYREALEMCRALYPREQFPRGHPALAQCLNNLGLLHWAAGEYSRAEPLCREALALRRTLYPTEQFPHGHPDLAESINGLALLYERAADYDRAEPLLREGLAMTRALYPRDSFPHGHPALALSLNNLAGLYQDRRDFDRAEPLFREALDTYQTLLLRQAELAAEAECLNYLKTQPVARDGLLSAGRHRSSPATHYDALWDSRAALTRLQERRHRDLMAGHDRDSADLADELRRVRLSLSGLLLRPGRNPDAHRAAVRQLTEAKEDLEKRIAARLRLAPPGPAAARPLVSQLIERLPEGTAFVDLYRYTDYEQDPDVPGPRGWHRTRRYVAFVLCRARPVARVELNEARPVEEAWAAWHRTLTAARPDDRAERAAAARFAALVWGPLRDALPADLKTVYLTPDGPLNRVPWGALPGRTPDSVLLDECAVCLVPHGPFLLERLGQRPPERSGDTLLAYGGIDYDRAPQAAPKGEDVRALLLREKRVVWKELPGTVREQEQVAALARKVLKDSPVTRGGRGAGTAQLVEDLPKARYAHLATHGFFADPAFRSALQLDPQLFERVSPDRRGGARSPLVLSGLVLAGANRQGEESAPDRGIITAEGLIGLRLEGLELAVLSACETGLGDDGGGEGVYGLQRALHVAGCQSVVASLWKVDDGATQALMALFYRNLWQKKLDPAEALRQAQLTLYRHPEAVETARKRGVDFTESDLPKVEGKPAEKPKRSPAAHWAAFTFSGVRPPAATK